MNKPIEPIVMQSESNLFSRLVKIDCKDHLEKKGKFTYLSWPWAVKMLRENDPTATWEVVMFDGKPYCGTPQGYFVQVSVTAGGVTLSQVHPILNNNNRPIQDPNAFDINTSIQRCLVKAIALHGLGLYVYAGEDLPSGDDSSEPKEAFEKFHSEAKKAAAGGTKSLGSWLKPYESNQEFRNFWMEFGDHYKQAAKNANEEMAGAM